MSFQQGLSGLNASSKNLEVIGNNIANASTYGAKVSRAEFADMYAAALNGSGTSNVGIGTKVQTVAQLFTQGNITTTENPMDLAIDGAGFFQVTDGEGPVSYTRNGQFKVDKNGYIVNNDQLKLLGYAASADGVIQPGQAVPLQLPTSGIEPKVSSEISVEGNLDSRLESTATGSSPAIDFDDAETYNKATTLSVYDVKGQAISLTYYFQKADAADTWNVFATADGESVSGTNDDPQAITQLVFEFAADGSWTLSPADPVAFTIPAHSTAAGVATMEITPITVDFTGMTQFGSAYSITDVTQDGNSAGELTSIEVDDDGIVTAKYSNGETRSAGQVEIANFRNPQGLQPLGDNLWAQTFSSGEPVTGVPGTGNLGSLQSGALEESNIDLTGELVDMITAQRIYQANAQTIKTQDQVLQTLVNLR